MQCNINRRGAQVRLVWGIVNLAAGAALAVVALWTAVTWLWLLAGACAALGALAVFEARKKWCVLRAMGVKTPM